MLSSLHFERMRQLALKLAGIELLDRHRELLSYRVQRLSDRGGDQLEVLLKAAEEGDSAAGRRLVGLLTTRFTGFFRHPRHFALAVEHALAEAGRKGSVCLWSAAAATGEEPYSLAMVLIEAFCREDPPVTVLATDISEESLEAAEEGEYGERAMSAVSSARRERFFTRKATGRWSVSQAVRRLVEFRPLNLAGEHWAITGLFDVIFCRNVLMYLEPRQRTAALEHLASHLDRDGLLIMDPTEYANVVRLSLAPGPGGVYSRTDATFPGRAPNT